MPYRLPVHHLYQLLSAIYVFCITVDGRRRRLFIGASFGKHKLCPKISPKKTVEGAIGGILFCDLTAVIIGLVFKFLVMPDANINFWALILLGVIDAPVSILGDLSFHLSKKLRNQGLRFNFPRSRRNARQV